ncbi:hypothetical protein EVAR_10415_1 [Eumeta japonica]|uniref:Uncharacterized protein n=1 Tax=Eumeta variegata TaxID=151549 RepID=A0A4C1UCT5_EUMVA|nr:hypothetical protein EVAR_10415_1 [Eumeta japonica]
MIESWLRRRHETRTLRRFLKQNIDAILDDTLPEVPANSENQSRKVCNFCHHKKKPVTDLSVPPANITCIWNIVKCSKVLAVYVTAGSVCWSLINRSNYEVIAWEYYGINYNNGKKLQITDIMNVVWKVVQDLPTADVFVMKAEATTLRASGSDPNNPKVIAVNLQMSQMVAMIVALLNARAHAERNGAFEDDTQNENTFNQRVYFLRPTLPFRLFNTLVGNERVSTDQTVETLFYEYSTVSKNNEHAYIPQEMQAHFRARNELQKDMLGHCLFLALTFMDVCIYKNQNSINKLSQMGRE